MREELAGQVGYRNQLITCYNHAYLKTIYRITMSFVYRRMWLGHTHTQPASDDSSLSDGIAHACRCPPAAAAALPWQRSSSSISCTYEATQRGRHISAGHRRCSLPVDVHCRRLPGELPPPYSPSSSSVVFPPLSTSLRQSVLLLFQLLLLCLSVPLWYFCFFSTSASMSALTSVCHHLPYHLPSFSVVFLYSHPTVLTVLLLMFCIQPCNSASLLSGKFRLSVLLCLYDWYGALFLKLFRHLLPLWSGVSRLLLHRWRRRRCRQWRLWDLRLRQQRGGTERRWRTVPVHLGWRRAVQRQPRRAGLPTHPENGTTNNSSSTVLLCGTVYRLTYVHWTFQWTLPKRD